MTQSASPPPSPSASKPTASSQTTPASVVWDQIRLNLDLSWRSHTAQENWTTKVDTKASIIFTVNGAAIAAILALRTQKGVHNATRSSSDHSIRMTSDPRRPL